MGPIPAGGTVAVTGASGFIGGWVVRCLLDQGYRVRACVRDPADPARTGFLAAMNGYASGRLSLHAADLDQPGTFDAVFAGCHGVAHLSHVTDYDDIAAVRRVCEHLITAVDAARSVRRVVITSSISAVMSEADMQAFVERPVFYEDRYPDEANPKRTPQRGQGYSIGKVAAERLFTDAAAASGRWETVVICPGDNVGPIQSAHQRHGGPWQRLIAEMLTGRCSQTAAYRPWMTVDVRDTALAHVAALQSVDVKNGERLIAWSTERRDVEQVCADIARLLPELRFDPPPVSDDFPERIRARETELRAIWAGCDLRNDRIRARLGLAFRPLDVSLRDCVESLIAIAGVQPRRRPG